MTRRPPIIDRILKRRAEREAKRGEDFTRPLIALGMMLLGLFVVLFWAGSP